MIKSEDAEKIINEWFCGDKKKVKKQIENESKLYVLSLIYAIEGLTKLNFKEALREVYEMSGGTVN